MSERADIIEKVIVTSASNKIPKDAKILNDLFQMCIDAQLMRSSFDSVHEKSLIKKLCRIWSVNKSDAIFKGAIRDSADNIQIKLVYIQSKISIPILSLN